MKRILVLVAITALIVSVIPFADSSDAAPEDTKISGYFYNEGKDLSQASKITIKVIYYDGMIAGEVVGETNTISAKDQVTGKNKFTVQITPGAETIKNKYYLYISIDGFSILNTNHSLSADPIEIMVNEGGTPAKKNCYQIIESGSLIEGENIIAPSEVITMKSSLGIVSGAVKMDTKGTVFLNNVTVTLYDIEMKKEVISTNTDYHGTYTIEYNTGNYEIRFELNGYDTVTETVTITEGGNYECNATMVKNENYFGLDLAHAMMILGGSAAVILLLFTMFVRVKLSKK